MNKKNEMRKLILLFSAFFLIGTAFAASDKTDFPYKKDIILSPSSSNAVFTLDQSVLQTANHKLSNLAIFDNDGEIVKFDLYREDYGRINDITALETSSVKDGMSIQNLVDDSVLTTFSFNERIDKKDASWVMIDLGSARLVSRIQIVVPEIVRIRYVEVTGGVEKNDLGTIMSKRSLSWLTDFAPKMARYVKVHN